MTMYEGFTVQIHPLEISPFEGKNFRGNLIEVRVSILYDGKEITLPYFNGHEEEDSKMCPDICFTHAIIGDIGRTFIAQQKLHHGDIVNYDFSRMIHKLRLDNISARRKKNNEDVLVNAAFFISLFEEIYNKGIYIGKACNSKNGKPDKWDNNIKNTIKFFDDNLIQSYAPAILELQNLLTFVRRSKYHDRIVSINSVGF